jgi:hypothetical protein
MLTRPENFCLTFVDTHGRQELFQIRSATTQNMLQGGSFAKIMKSGNCFAVSVCPHVPQFPVGEFS